LIQVHDKKFVPFISSEELDRINTELAGKINLAYEGKKPIILGVLNGSFMFISDLMKKLNMECELSFIKLSSYQGTQSQGEVQEVIGLNTSLKGRDVIVLEDIIDTGNTLNKILDLLREHESSSLAIGTLLLKPEVFNNRYTVDFVGIEIPDKFVIGYGLDYDQLGRNLDQIFQHDV